MNYNKRQSWLKVGSVGSLWAQARFIKDAIEKNVIKPLEPDSESRKHAKYVPFWA
jgi:hypothetical protein